MTRDRTRNTAAAETAEAVETTVARSDLERAVAATISELERAGGPAAQAACARLVAAYLAQSERTRAAGQLLAACKAAADLLRRCDAEQRPSDLPYATDDDWDAVVEQLADAIRAAEWANLSV